jgi:hypothetical protein
MAIFSHSGSLNFPQFSITSSCEASYRTQDDLMPAFAVREQALPDLELFMIDLYYWTTPNGHKISLYLEEAGLAYKVNPINISQGEQFQPHFLKISPNTHQGSPCDRKSLRAGTKDQPAEILTKAVVARELLPLECVALTIRPAHFDLSKCVLRITTAAQPSGSKLPRHRDRINLEITPSPLARHPPAL